MKLGVGQIREISDSLRKNWVDFGSVSRTVSLRKFTSKLRKSDECPKSEPEMLENITKHCSKSLRVCVMPENDFARLLNLKFCTDCDRRFLLVAFFWL
jgi:hypothetical protein